METIELELLCTIYGGDETPTAADPGPVRDENTGGCGPGPWNFGKTKECEAHDDCVGRWTRRVGRPAADVICGRGLIDAAKSAVRCALDPLCPK